MACAHKTYQTRDHAKNDAAALSARLQKRHRPRRCATCGDWRVVVVKHKQRPKAA